MGSFPLLRSLSLFFTGPEFTPRQDDQFWDFIFPQTDGNGEPLVIRGLTELVVSYCGGCDSELNTRIRRLFPNLLRYRHVKEYRGDEVWGCEELSDGVCTREKFLMCTRAEIRLSVEVRLDKVFIDRLSFKRNLDYWNQIW